MTHGWECNARTIPIDCRSCGERVFWFRCDCGSSVVFADLGQPWPQHHCLERAIEEIGKDAAARGLAKLMMSPVYGGNDRRISPTYAKKVANRIRQTPSLQRMDPYAGVSHSDTGVIREVIQGVDLARRFRAPPGSIAGRVLLKEIPEDSTQITIHTAYEEDHDPGSFTFYVPPSILRGLRPEKGDIVQIRIRGVAIPAFEVFWVCEGIERL
jgi:hypothetical protein